MKQRDKTLRATALAIAFVYILAGFVLADELVLCVGEDGRVSVEEAHDGCCSGSHRASHHDRREEGDGCICGSCFDLPLTAAKSDAAEAPDTGRTAGSPYAPETAGGPFDGNACLPPSLSARPPGATAVATSAHAILRTSVILI